MLPQTAMEAIMDMRHGNDPAKSKAIVLSLQQTFNPVAVTCPTSANAMNQDVRELVLFPSGFEAALAYIYDSGEGDDLYLLFLKWKLVKQDGKDVWVVDTRRIPLKFEQSPSLRLQLYPEMRLVALQDGNDHYIAVPYECAIPEKHEKLFPRAQVVSLEKLLKFAINDRPHFEP